MKIKTSTVYFTPVDKNSTLSDIARRLLQTVIEENQITLEKTIPLKVHFGQPGNQTFIKPNNFKGIIDYLAEQQIKTYYIETNTATGPREYKIGHENTAKEHGFTQIPVVIADGVDGFDHQLVSIENGKHFKQCKIASKLAEQKQIIVLSHFKGHILSGLAGAIKMLGVGFASGRGKTELHSSVEMKHDQKIDWTDWTKLYQQNDFIERSTEYALAAIKNKNMIYVNFAISITKNCDCDGEAMTPIYKDLGIFASTDPVAIDKACFDMLEKREGKKPFTGDAIFSYAEKLGLGSTKYSIKSVI